MSISLTPGSPWWVTLSLHVRRCAEISAEDGDYLGAIQWLRALELIDGTLPKSMAALRTECVERFGEQMGEKCRDVG